MPTAGERRIVTVLLADIVGSTGIAERLGPERSKFLFDEVVGRMGDEVRGFGGTVALLMGDGLFALFGAPVAHEDDSERAARAALAIHQALTSYAGEVEQAYGVHAFCPCRYPTPARLSCQVRTLRARIVTTRSATRSMSPRVCSRLQERAVSSPGR